MTEDEDSLSVNDEAGHVTIDAGSGDDYINNINPHVSINAGDGNDFILQGQFSTVRGGAGNDTFNDIAPDSILYQYADGDGNDIITRYESSDTVSITDHSLYSTLVSNNDVIVSIGSGSITLKNASDKTLNIKGGIRLLDGTDNPDLFNIEPSDGDFIINSFDANDTIQLASGSITSYSRNANDFIVTLKSGSNTSNVTLKSAGGYELAKSGNNLIVTDIVSLPSDYTSKSNSKKSSKINGSAGKDYIVNTADNVTVQGNGGNDIIIGSTLYGDLFLFGAGDGHDSILNFDSKDTLQITSGSISTISTVNNDLLINVRGQSSVGSVTLKDAANQNITVKGDYLTVIPDINTLTSSADHSKITGTTGRDYIINAHNYITVQAGAPITENSSCSVTLPTMM